MELESWKVLLFWNLILPSLISLKESLGAQLSWQLLEFSWCSFLQSQNKALAWFSHIQDFWTFRKEGTFLLLGLYPSQIIHSILLFIHPSFCFRSNCVRPSLMKVEGPVYQLLCFLLLLCSVNLTSLWFFFFLIKIFFDSLISPGWKIFLYWSRMVTNNLWLLTHQLPKEDSGHWKFFVPQDLVFKPFRRHLAESLLLVAALHACFRLWSFLAASLNPIVCKLRMKRCWVF